MTNYDTPEKMDKRRVEIAAAIVDTTHFTTGKSLRLTDLIGTNTEDFDRVYGFDDGEGPRGSY